MKKSIIIIISILVVGLVIFLWYKYFNSDQSKLDTSNNTAPTTNTANDAFPLQYGSAGSKVAMLQRYLNKYSSFFNYPILTIDGVFGKQTESNLETHLQIKSVDETLYNHLIQML